jgi:inorganic pyrophosphatase
VRPDRAPIESLKEDVAMGFFDALDELVAKSEIRIDRPCGTAHPQHREVVYPLDYGYLDGTLAGDRGGIDVFRGSASGAGVVGAYMTVDRLKRDLEAKILVDCTQVEIVAAGEFLADALHLSPHLVARY